MPDPVEITPTALDVYRDWSYPCGEAEPGTPIVINPPDDDIQVGTRRHTEEDEEPVGIVVITVAADGRLFWRSHVVGEYALPSEVLEEHQEMLRQAVSQASALIEYDEPGPDGPMWKRKPGR